MARLAGTDSDVNIGIASGWREVEYAELNSNGRTLYGAFYQLATMTFTWNASLATAFGVLLTVRQSIEPNAFLLASISIPMVAIIYNMGAGAGYQFIHECFYLIQKSMEELELPDYIQTPELLGQLMGGKIRKAFGLHRLTILFFSTLVVIWSCLLVYAINERFPILNTVRRLVS